jgi:ATP-binding cassette subfamily B protein
MLRRKSSSEQFPEEWFQPAKVWADAVFKRIAGTHYFGCPGLQLSPLDAAVLEKNSLIDNLGRYAYRPLAFLWRYVRMRPISHFVILVAVVGAVACSVGTQYSVKFLVDILSKGYGAQGQVWFAFALLVGLIAGDNLLWRVAGWIASHAFVSVTGDLRGDLFRYLTGHSPSYFQDRRPGMLTSRITSTSNAMFTMENMFIWNVMPPCLATAGSIAFLSSLSIGVTACMVVVAAILSLIMYRLAAAGQPLHHGFADRAAAVDGEMFDIIGNMPIVRAFGGARREYARFQETVGHELTPAFCISKSCAFFTL